MFFYPESWTITFPSVNGKSMKVAFENVRFAAQREAFVATDRHVNYELDDETQFILFNTSPKLSQENKGADIDSSQNKSDIPFEPDYSAEPSTKGNLGDNISVHWPLRKYHYKGRIHEINGDKQAVFKKTVM